MHGEPTVKEIFVKQSALADPDPYALVGANVDFVETMRLECGYASFELPPDAMRSCHVYLYFLEVASGGLVDFVRKGCWRPRVVRDCHSGLQAMGLKAQLRVFRKLLRLLAEDERWVEELVQSRESDELRSVLHKLEDDFIRKPGEAVMIKANAKWLRRLPELSVVADDAYDAVVEKLKAANPLRETRLAAHHRANIRHCLESTLQAGARLLCWEAWRAPVVRVTAAEHGTTPDGRRTAAWRVHSAQGSHSAYFCDDLIFLSDRYLLADGRRVNADILEQQRDLDNAGSQHLRDAPQGEAAGLERSVLEKATAAARAKPVTAAADILCGKLRPAETLVEMSPMAEAAPDFDVWAVITDRRICILNLKENGAVLTDADGATLAEASGPEIDALARADADIESWA